MLLRFAYFLLKKKYASLIVYLRRHSKEFGYIMISGQKSIKLHFNNVTLLQAL